MHITVTVLAQHAQALGCDSQPKIKRRKINFKKLLSERML